MWPFLKRLFNSLEQTPEIATRSKKRSAPSDPPKMFADEWEAIVKAEAERQAKKQNFIGPPRPRYPRVYVDPRGQIVGRGTFPGMLIVGSTTVMFNEDGPEWRVVGFDRRDKEQRSIVNVEAVRDGER